MKTVTNKWALLALLSALAANLALAHDSATEKQHSQATDSQSASQNAIRFSKLKDAKVTSNAGESLGTVEDMLINPATGKIDFVVLGQGGLLGVGEKRIPVPWQAINVQSEKQFTVNVDQNKLKSAPSLDKDYSQMASPDYAITIYRFYEVPAGGPALGGSEGPGGSQQGQGSGSSPGSGSSQPNQR